MHQKAGKLENCYGGSHLKNKKSQEINSKITKKIFQIFEKIEVDIHKIEKMRSLRCKDYKFEIPTISCSKFIETGWVILPPPSPLRYF